MRIYIPRDEIVILRTNHLNELRTTGKTKLESKRSFNWLSDETLITIIHKYALKFKRREEYVIHCTHNGTPFYILGVFGKFYGKFSFTVISTIKTKSSIFPFSKVDMFHRFVFDTDLNTFESKFSQDEYNETLDTIIAENNGRCLATLEPKDKVPFIMDRLKQRVANRVKLEKEEVLKQKQQSDKRYAAKRYSKSSNKRRTKHYD